jgi:hypothetical protein
MSRYRNVNITSDDEQVDLDKEEFQPETGDSLLTTETPV